MEINFKGTVVEKVSKKTGNPYKCLMLKITPTYEKQILLDEAELQLLNVVYNDVQRINK